MGVAIVITAIGVLILAAFIYTRTCCNTPIEATVSKIREQKHYYRGRTTWEYTPEFTYVVDGKKYTSKADSPTRDANRYEVGQKLRVFYDPRHPENTRVTGNLGFFAVGLVLTAAGLALMAIAML